MQTLSRKRALLIPPARCRPPSGALVGLRRAALAVSAARPALRGELVAHVLGDLEHILPPEPLRAFKGVNRGGFFVNFL